jgi:hypothetical protein
VKFCAWKALLHAFKKLFKRSIAVNGWLTFAKEIEVRPVDDLDAHDKGKLNIGEVKTN